MTKKQTKKSIKASKTDNSQFILALIAVVAVVALVGMVTLVMNQRSSTIVQPSIEAAAPVGELYYKMNDGTLVPESEVDENMLGNLN